jgi:virginiamycin B lyase
MVRRHALCRFRKGEFKVFALPRDDARPVSVAVDSKGNIWYADLGGWVGVLTATVAQRD